MIRVTIIRQGSDESAEVKEFLAAQINIGRVERNDLVLANSRVSSVHARAIEAEAGITLIDNNSTNGTFVNGALVRGPVTVDPEDSVEIGSFTLHFERVHVDEVLEDVSEIAPSEFEEFPQEESTEPVEQIESAEHFDQPGHFEQPGHFDQPGHFEQPAEFEPADNFDHGDDFGHGGEHVEHTQQADPSDFGEPDMLPLLTDAPPVEPTPPDAFVPQPRYSSRPEPAARPEPVARTAGPTRTAAPSPGRGAVPTARRHAVTSVDRAPEPRPSQVGVITVPDERVVRPTLPAAPATGLAGAFEQTAAGFAAEGAQAHGDGKAEARALVYARAAVDACCADLDPRQRRQWSEWIAREVAGAGPLTDLLADETVAEILVQGGASIEVRRDGARVRHPTRFSCARAVEYALERLIGAAPSPEHPAVDGVAGDGVAVHALGSPLVHGGPVVLLARPQSGPRSLAELVAQGHLGTPAANHLEEAAQRGANVLVCAPPGIDAAPWIAAISAAVPATCRVVAVHRGVIARGLAERAIVVDGARDIIGALRSALRLRGDSLIVHEVAGLEAMELCAAARRGVGSTIASVVAASPEGALARLQAMVSLGVVGDPAAIRSYVSGCFDLVLALRDGANGRVVAGTLAEIRHAHAGELVELFTHDG